MMLGLYRLNPPVKHILLAASFVYYFLFFMFRVCHAFLSVHYSLVVTCWERANLLALLYVMFLVFVTFQCGALGQVLYLVVSIPDLCLLTYFGFSLKSITVPLGTVSLGAIGFMSIRNKSWRTLVNPNFALLIPGHNLFYILEALL